MSIATTSGLAFWLGVFHEGNDQIKAIARAAESMGFAGIALPDHIVLPKGYKAVHPSGERHIEHYTRFPDTLITAATIAAVTERLRVMSYIYVLPMREPFSVAKQVATLCEQSGHRFDFGVGAGWCEDEFAVMGQDFHTRGARMEEMLAVMRGFWERPEFGHRGRFFDFPVSGQAPLPSRRVPVWVGGKSRAALARAARNDGWLGMNYPMDEIRTLLATLAEERDRHLQAGGIDHGNFRRFVIPLAMPSAEVYATLGEWGVDGTVVMPWGVDDPAFASLEAKLGAMERFAAIYMR